jgi:pullulanase/glycogen debranching enzyme
MDRMLAGDEVRRSQGGNNNACCQDNETSWLDWSLVARYVDVHRFAKALIALRAARQSAVDHQVQHEPVREQPARDRERVREEAFDRRDEDVKTVLRLED